MRRPDSPRLLPLGILVLGAFTAAAAAQVGVPTSGDAESGLPSGPSYGTTDFSVHTIQAFGFEPFNGASVFSGTVGGGRYLVSGNTCLETSLSLPSGAVIDHIEIEGCDETATDIQASIYACQAGACSHNLEASTSGTPGCGLFPGPSGALLVDNRNKSYMAQVCIGTTGLNMALRAVRYFYRLQVSPAPGTASFLDVPTTDPFFQYIEALKASGITGGCGNGTNFCPDQPVLRKQMATFLAKALGLHWTN